MDFALNPMQRELVERARRFVDEVCAPYDAVWPLSDYDVDPEVLGELRRKFTEWGFRAIAVPKEAGGQGLGVLAKSLVYEQLWRSIALRGIGVTWSAYLDPHPALHDAPDWQRRKYLDPVLRGEAMYHICISEPDHGSDAAGIELRAERRGGDFILNGLKRWTPDPFHPLTRPDYLLVYAVTAPGHGYKGISTLLVDFPSAGIDVESVVETTAPGSFLGRVSDLRFTDVLVPAENLLGAENEGFHYVQDQLNRNRAVIAASSVGEAQRCLDLALDYAQTRQTFGQPLAERQFVQFSLAEMEIDIQMARALAYRAAWAIDSGADARSEVAMAKARCPQLACSVIDRAIQILGGIGCRADMRMGETYFMHRIAQIAEGSVEMMKTTIFRGLLARPRSRETGVGAATGS
ncbi:acyl-CoA dehydrogenase family protein [Mycobacterium marseillense]|uniref:acyl-CoA dehydrogenase family protein n=1 Tax=Mycobacterium marseillense TaxID=701042 RepID=UPI002598FDCD|nr:acyl-CoA dehydrogenase family protein [Mycobacterium marseillense]MDM3975292.1 acyl-CoA dehydrogenase family protein [Mycobacterium marseillense]